MRSRALWFIAPFVWQAACGGPDSTGTDGASDADTHADADVAGEVAEDVADDVPPDPDAESGAVPRVTPTTYTFRNASPGHPESQAFRIYNDFDQATAPFQVTSVHFEAASPELTLDPPNPSGTVSAPGANESEVTFTVTYTPLDDTPDFNAVIVETDVGDPIHVGITTLSVHGDYTLTYSHADHMDFGGAAGTRSVLVTCIGPGPIAISAPSIEPAGARAAFSVRAWAPSVQAGTPDAEITSWPRGIPVGRSLRFDVAFDGGGDADGTLTIPIENPDPAPLEIPLAR